MLTLLWLSRAVTPNQRLVGRSPTIEPAVVGRKKAPTPEVKGRMATGALAGTGEAWARPPFHGGNIGIYS